MKKRRHILYGVLGGLFTGLIFDLVASSIYPSGLHLSTVGATGLLGGLVAIAWSEASRP